MTNLEKSTAIINLFTMIAASKNVDEAEVAAFVNKIYKVVEDNGSMSMVEKLYDLETLDAIIKEGNENLWRI